MRCAKYSNLIHQLAAIPNVYVIASSRTFEFNHDARFRTIEAEELHLALPKWEEIKDILSQLEIDGTKWPDSFRDILCTPQNLKIFVEHLAGTSEQKVFESYQQMLEDRLHKAEKKCMNTTFVKGIFEHIHQNSIRRQEAIMNKEVLPIK